MTVDEFLTKYNGSAIDYDGAFGVQCVDLAKLFIDKMLGIKAKAYGNAHEYFDNFENIEDLKNNFIKIENTKDFIPQKGDLCVWSTKLDGKNGHIAIADGQGTKTYFYSYDTNWGSPECKRVKHSYKNFLGVLRLKKLNKYKCGEKVKVNYKFTGAIQGQNKLVEIESNPPKQVWINSEFLSGIIAYASEQKYIVDFGIYQLWVDEEKIIGKV